MQSGDATKILLAMQTGFDKVHEKFDNKFKDLNDEMRCCREECTSRLNELEIKNKVKAAVNGVKQEEQKKKVDVWKYIIRGAASLGGAAALTWLVLMIANHMNLLPAAFGK